MKFKKLYLIIVFTLGLTSFRAQLMTKNLGQFRSQFSTEPFTPEAIFDTLFDQNGEKYSLEDLRIKQSPIYRTNGSNGVAIQPQSTITFSTCNAGYFKLYFEIGSGMEGNSPTEISRRSVICQVFSDLALFINSPLTSNGGKVNIFIRDITNMGVSNPSNNLTLGLGSTFYSIPGVQQSLGGIADNLIWQTVTSGTDAFVNIANPLMAPLLGNGNFYHGMLAINFANPLFTWNTQLNAASLNNEYDLYTIALHEVAHSMGFGSLIDQNGQSKMGPTRPYYSRFDTYLKTQSNVSLIAQTTGTCSNIRYQWDWNSLLSPNILQPGFISNNSCITDNTICNTAINFVGSVTQPVYTPNCFAGGSTLSHFEDQCLPPTPGNNLYFVMSDAANTGPNYMKRYFKPEERLALCDIGYSCSTNFGNSINLNYYNYGGSTCLGAQVAGINDGISPSGFYTYVGNVGAPISLTGLLSNDRFTSANGNTFKCMELVSGSGILSVTSGITTNFTPSVVGLHLLRYIPRDGATGKEGNITYIYVWAQTFAQSGTCTPSSCNIINNGSFENGTSCGQYTQDLLSVNCWTAMYASPDCFRRNCTAGLNSWYGVPTGTFFCSPASDTWNNGNLGNNTFIGLWDGGSLGGEGMETQLSSNLIPNTLYNLSFWAKTANNLSSSNYSDLLVAGTSSFIPYSWSTFTVPPLMTQLALVQIPNDNQWNYYSLPISFTTSVPLSFLSVHNVGELDNTNDYIFIDDISVRLLDSAVSFTPPLFVCKNTVLNNLLSYVTIPGGTFSGTGVTLNNATGFYEFNSNANLNGGSYPVVYSYTLNGCMNTLVKTISIPTLALSPSTQTMCATLAATLTANGANSYTWSNGATGSSIVVTPSVNTIYTVSGIGTNSCVVSQTASVFVSPNLSLNPITSTICSGKSVTIIATGDNANVYNWNTGSSNPTIIVSPTITSLYTVTGTNMLNSCYALRSATVNVVSCVGISELTLEEEINIYPNPVSNQLFIETRVPVNIILFDAIGRKLMERNSQEDISTIEMSIYSKGIYLLKIATENKTKEIKIIKLD